MSAQLARFTGRGSDVIAFATAVESWKCATSARAAWLLESFEPADELTAALLLEEKHAPQLALAGDTGGWGSVAQATVPKVLLIGERPYQMALRSPSGTSFGRVTVSDHHFLWMLDNCCRVWAGNLPPWTYEEWRGHYSVPLERSWSAPKEYLVEVASGRIMNQTAARDYFVDREEVTVMAPKGRAGEMRVTTLLPEIEKAGQRMIWALLSESSDAGRQLVVALGAPARKWLATVLSPTNADAATHVLAHARHPSPKWVGANAVREEYLNVITHIVSAKGRGNP